MKLRNLNPYNKDTAFDQWVAYEEGKVDQYNADRAFGNYFEAKIKCLEGTIEDLLRQDRDVYQEGYDAMRAGISVDAIRDKVVKWMQTPTPMPTPPTLDLAQAIHAMLTREEGL